MGTMYIQLKSLFKLLLWLNLKRFCGIFSSLILLPGLLFGAAIGARHLQKMADSSELGSFASMMSRRSMDSFGPSQKDSLKSIVLRYVPRFWIISTNPKSHFGKLSLDSDGYKSSTVNSSSSSTGFAKYFPIAFFLKEPNRYFHDIGSQLNEEDFIVPFPSVKFISNQKKVDVYLSEKLTREEKRETIGLNILKIDMDKRQFAFCFQQKLTQKNTKEILIPYHYMMNAIYRSSDFKENIINLTTTPIWCRHLPLNFWRFIFSMLLSMGLSFCLPYFTYVLVQERAEKITVLLRYNNFRLSAYILAHYCNFLVLFLMPFTLFIITSIVIGSSMFSYGGGRTVLYLYSILAQNTLHIALSFLAALVFKNPRKALNTMIFISSLVNTAASLSSSDEYYFLHIIPSWSGTKIAGYLSENLTYEISEFFKIQGFTIAFIVQILYLIVLWLLIFYLYQVIDRDGEGSPKPWYFPFIPLITLIKKRFAKNTTSTEDVTNGVTSDETGESRELLDKKINDYEEDCALFEEIDEDVAREVRAVGDIDSMKDKFLVIKDLTKVYDDGKLAVNKVSFALESNIIFGLLGPNGAGKSTLVQVLCCLHAPTSGEVRITGYNIFTEQEKIYDVLGYCPQFDVFWKDLPVKIHLNFFLSIKGFSGAELKKRREELLHMVQLTPHTNTPASKLSGGEKRRLSIAIAFSGKPKVVILDEPTTGLDPEVRQFIWNVIREAKKEDCLIILTTHSMEEAEALSDKITIMAKGTMRCFGTPTHLKQKFGGSTILNFNCKKSPQLIEFLEDLTEGRTEVDNEGDLGCRVLYHGPKTFLPSIYRAVQERLSQFEISAWGISQPSLNQVFQNIVLMADADA